jgi:hypothetical protein
MSVALDLDLSDLAVTEESITRDLSLELADLRVHFAEGSIETERPTPVETERTPRNSYLRLRTTGSVLISPPVWVIDESAARSESFIAALGKDHMRLGVLMMKLDQRIERLRQVPARPEIEEAAVLLRDYAQDLGELRAAISKVYFCATDVRMSRLVGPRTNLGTYLKGLYAFAEGLALALTELAMGADAGEPDWSALGARIASARLTHFPCLAEQIKADIRGHRIDFWDPSDPLQAIGEHLDELFWTAFWLSRRE